MKHSPADMNQPEQEKPPIFSSWSRWYMAVLLNLAVLILLFFLFMKAFD